MYDYATGSSPELVSLPDDALLTAIWVVADPGAGATCSIDDGGDVPIPPGATFEPTLVPVELPGPLDVVIGGTPAAWFVAWTIAEPAPPP